MSKQIKDGGLAFPQQIQMPEGLRHHNGMTLRDYFASKAIGSVIENCKGDTRIDGESQDTYFARISYQIADAMIEAREAKS